MYIGALTGLMVSRTLLNAFATSVINLNHFMTKMILYHWDTE